MRYIPSPAGRHETRLATTHAQAIGELFTQVLGLCAEAGLVSVGVVAIDGTRIAANASAQRNVDYSGLAREILAEADRIDREEDQRFGDARGDELPEQLQTAEGRRQALADAKRRLEEKRGAAPQADPVKVSFDDQKVIEMHGRGRRSWHVSARQQVDEHRRREGRPVPRDRAERLSETEQRMWQLFDGVVGASTDPLDRAVWLTVIAGEHQVALQVGDYLEASTTLTVDEAHELVLDLFDAIAACEGDEKPTVEESYVTHDLKATWDRIEHILDDLPGDLQRAAVEDMLEFLHVRRRALQSSSQRPRNTDALAAKRRNLT